MPHQSADGRTLSVDFTFARGAFTVASAYAPCAAASRAAFFIQILPNISAQRQLLLGGDFNCIADQLDILDPAGAAGGRMAGYYNGLRIIETEHQPTTCGGTGTQPAAHSHMPAQQAYQQPGLTGGSCLSSCGCGSEQHPAASRRQPATLGTTLALRSPSQLPGAPASSAQHGGYCFRSSMTRPSA